jgi:ABC-type uncharacterized transport system involved in gliding motility auxiliary subunit
VSVLLAALILGMLNFLSYRYLRTFRWDISASQYYSLSQKTRGILKESEGTVHILAVIRNGFELYADIRFLLQEYDYAAADNPHLDLTIEWVDPDRDLARAAEISKQYDIKSPNVIVFESGERRTYIEASRLMDYKREVDYSKTQNGRPTIKRSQIGFRGEQIFTSAILNVLQAAPPTIYFLTGHGEHETADRGKPSGYSTIVQRMRRDNMTIKPLFLARTGRVPDDASAVIIAGPGEKISQAETAKLSSYLDERNGRLMLLTDAGADTGLDHLLQHWQVKLGHDTVVGLTLTGRELFVTNYADHVITERLMGKATMFYQPRSVNPMEHAATGREPSADKPSLTLLAASTAEGWAESTTGQTPPVFDPKTDRIGPIPIAVAVEKGPVSDIDVDIKPTRLVVIGDSDFAANDALRTGVGANSDFFLNAVNWLLERNTLIGVAPKAPGVLRLGMNREQARLAFLLLVFGAPGLAALCGLAVWWRRRQ